MKKDVITYCVTDGKLGNPKVYYANPSEKTEEYLSENEKAVAMWVMKNNKHAGATTQTTET